MKTDTFAFRIREHVETEIEAAAGTRQIGDLSAAFQHLERAHVLGQSVTAMHTRVHWLMLKIGWRRRDAREVFGQMLRLVGASTKTPLGIYPRGNTGGANVSPIRPMPIPTDLEEIIRQARSDNRPMTSDDA